MSVLSLVGILSGVQYIIFGPLVMHVRFVAAAVGAMRSLASMFGPPDGDMYEEDFAEQRDLRQTVAATDRQTVPGSAAARMGAVGVAAPVGRAPAGPVAPPVGASGTCWCLRACSACSSLRASSAFFWALAGRSC